MLNSFQIGLLLHIIGLTMAVGTTLGSYVLSGKFRVQYNQDKEKGLAIMQAISILPRLAGIGLGVQLISGVMMLTAAGGGYGQQLWFRIKMIVVVLIIAGSIVLNRGMQRQLRQWVLDDIAHGNKSLQIGILARRISYVQLFILAFFLVIFILSIFRVN